jgi:hypothetical protein
VNIQDILLEIDRGLKQILCEHTQRGRFMARPKLSKGISYLIVSSEDMMELKTIEFLLQPSYFLPVGCHADVMTIRLSLYLIDNELGVSTNVKSLNSEFGGDVQTVN